MGTRGGQGGVGDGQEGFELLGEVLGAAKGGCDGGGGLDLGRMGGMGKIWGENGGRRGKNGARRGKMGQGGVN